MTDYHVYLSIICILLISLSCVCSNSLYKVIYLAIVISLVVFRPYQSVSGGLEVEDADKDLYQEALDKIKLKNAPAYFKDVYNAVFKDRNNILNKTYTNIFLYNFTAHLNA